MCVGSMRRLTSKSVIIRPIDMPTNIKTDLNEI